MLEQQGTPDRRGCAQSSTVSSSKRVGGQRRSESRAPGGLDGLVLVLGEREQRCAVQCRAGLATGGGSGVLVLVLVLVGG